MPSTASLLFSELRYRRLFEAAHDGILIVDPLTRKIVDVNPFLIEFMGYAYEEFIGKELFEIGLWKDAAANQAAFAELKQEGCIRYEDLPLKRKDGGKLEVEFVSNLYQEGEGQIIQCNIRDISKRKAVELALREAETRVARHAADLEITVLQRTTELRNSAAELRSSNSQLETFVYSIAHDLRGPLRSMQGFSQLLSEDDSLSSEGKSFAKLIDSASQKMDALLTDLLAFSHINQCEMKLAPISVDLAIDRALDVCTDSIKNSSAMIEKIPPFPWVFAEPAILQQVLVNLISNGLKYVRDRAPKIRFHAEHASEGFIRIWVEDNGIGIDEKSHARIFEVFQRLHTKSYEGTGIGLAIVQKGIERMGGQVGVKSVLGVGSRFWIELRQAATQHETPQPVDALLLSP